MGNNTLGGSPVQLTVVAATLTPTGGPNLSPQPPVIVWFRHDLRLADNAALTAAVAEGRPLLGVYVLDETGSRPAGGAGRWWLHHSLQVLDGAMRTRGASLLLLRGKAEAGLGDLAAAIGANAVHWTAGNEPAAAEQERRVAAALERSGIAAHVHGGGLLALPGSITTRAGGPVKVFARFWQTLRERGAPSPARPAPKRLPPPPAGVPGGMALAELGLLPSGPDWAGGLRDHWHDGRDVGEAAAQARLDGFLDGGLADYATGRDYPARPAVSGLSAHLRWGEIGPCQVWHAALARHGWTRQTEAFLRELAWREFAYHLLHHFPDLTTTPLDARFAAFPWQHDAALQQAWRRGRTGYPLVDAGMRELWRTGVMHNRVRMVAASFLVKHLLQPWQDGEAWFWDTLVDADPANNPVNWQWVAGCGADAAPFFRIFNPVLQGEKFDPEGAYVRRWVPELAALPDKHVHAPWTALEAVLWKAQVRLGETYPLPIVDHAAARARALAAFRALPKRG